MTACIDPVLLRHDHLLPGAAAVVLCPLLANSPRPPPLQGQDVPDFYDNSRRTKFYSYEPSKDLHQRTVC